MNHSLGNRVVEVILAVLLLAYVGALAYAMANALGRTQDITCPPPTKLQPRPEHYTPSPGARSYYV